MLFVLIQIMEQTVAARKAITEMDSLSVIWVSSGDLIFVYYDAYNFYL